MEYNNIKFKFNVKFNSYNQLDFIFKEIAHYLNIQYDEKLKPYFKDNEDIYIIEDVSNLSVEIIEEIVASFFDFTFDNIINVPLYKFLVLKRNTHLTVLAIIHSSIFDYSSVNKFYEIFNEVKDNPLENNFISYYDDVNTYLNSSYFEKDSLYWKEYHTDIGEYVRYYNLQSDNYKHIEILLKGYDFSNFLNNQNTSKFNFILSIFSLYLSRIDRTKGCFLKTFIPYDDGSWSFDKNTILKIDYIKDDSFAEYLNRVNAIFLEAVKHTKVDIGYYLDENLPYYSINDFSKFNEVFIENGEDSALTMNIYKDSLDLIYNSDLFSEEYAERMAKNIESLIDNVVSFPDQLLKDINIISNKEKVLLSDFCKGKTVEVDNSKYLPQAFRENAIKYPDTIAIDDGINKITFKELEKSSNSIANDLCQNYDIGRGSHVALMLPRSYHVPELVLALNKIGATFIPIDLFYPINRIEYMLEISQAEHIITSEEIANSFNLKENIIYIEDLNDSNDVDVDIVTCGDDLFTILFTSGTTGLPKGVMISNNQIPGIAVSFKGIFNYSHGDVIGHYLGFAFVVVFVVFAALYFGGCCRIFNEDEQKDSLLLIKELKRTHMNSLILPPGVGIPIFENEDLNLDYLVLAGSKLNELSKKERQTQLVNFYGTTEIICAITKIYDLKDINDDVPIGRPVANTYVYILDEYDNQMPIGVPGEICVSNNYLSPGYINNQELTDDVFVDNPYSDCEDNRRMYRTGDIGFYNFDGNIEIIGREDDQLSVGGFRIESGEILNVMKSFEEISEVYLDVDYDILVAYYTVNNEVDINEVKNALKMELPYYMVPSLFVELDEIPLNINGKIDKSAIKNIFKENSEIIIEDELLTIVIDAFKDILQFDSIFMDDDFVELGGNSLSAMNLQILLKEKLNVNLCASEIIELSTPINIANHIKYNLEDYDEMVLYSFDDFVPLSESQLNVYLDECVNERGTGYNNPFKISFNKYYSVDEIKDAIAELLVVFPVLKARFNFEKGNIPRCSFDAEIDVKEGVLKDIEYFVRPFELDKSLSRFLIVAEEYTNVLCCDFHHTIFDGTSLIILLNTLYSILNKQDIPTVDDGILRQISFEANLTSNYMDEAQKVLDAMLVDRDECYELLESIDKDDEFEYIDVFDFDNVGLNSFLQSNSITRNQFFASVFAYTLSRFVGSNKVLFNLVEDGRGHIDLSESVGMYVRTLPLLLDCTNQDVKSFLKYSSNLINSLMKYDLYAFNNLVNEYDLNSDILFQYSHDIFRHSFNDNQGYKIDELKHGLQGDLSFFIFDYGENQFGIKIKYSDKFSHDFIKRFTESYKMILQEMMCKDKLGDLDYISESDLEILDKINKTQHNLYYNDVLDAFNDNLAKCPNNALVSMGSRVYSYGEGAFVGDKIAKQLIDLGVGSQDCVAFFTERSEFYMFAVLGILSMGGVYVPLDDELPDERIKFMLNDINSKVIIVSDETYSRAIGLLDDLNNENVVLLNISDILKEDIGSISRLPVVYGDIAGILYTSGSTGLPKGVKVTRKAILNVAEYYADIYGLCSSDVYALYPSIGFDAGCESLFKAIYAGACLSIVPKDIRYNMEKLNDYFIRQNVTHTIITTQVGKLFMESIEDTSLDYLFVGGEKLGEFPSPENYQLVDEYGPTEANNFVSSLNNSKKIDPSSIGGLNYNSKAYVLDDNQRRVPWGAVGELYLAGYQIAEGYLNRDDETNESFLKNPFDDDEEYSVIYRTGDIVRLLPDGSLGIVGRRDSQVKIRGNRVELSEIESVIREIDYVEDVTVQAVKIDDNYELVAYVVVSEELDDNVLKSNICDYVGEFKPMYMVPSFVISLDEIPLNINGKVDRDALPEVDLDSLRVEYVAPTNETEKRIVEAFENVFGQENIGIHDDFSRLGGDSLAAIKLLTFLRDYNISVADILSLRTPYAIASSVKTYSLDLDVYSLDSGCPLTESQLNVYLDIVVNDKVDAYLMPFSMIISKKYEVHHIIDSLNRMFEVHHILGMCVIDELELPYLVKGSNPPIIVDSNVGEEFIVDFLTQPFDLHDSLCRFLIVEDNDEFTLFAVFHHIIFDALSEGVFKHDLFSLLEGESVDIDDSFLKVAAFDQQIQETDDYAKAGKFFDSMLVDSDDAGNLLDCVFSDGPGYSNIDLDLDYHLFKTFLDDYNISENILFTGVFAYSLSRFVGNDKVLFNIVENGRDRFSNHDAIGMFVKTVPLFVNCKNQSILSFMEYVSDRVYGVLGHNYYPFRLLANKYDISSDILFEFIPDWIRDGNDLAGNDEGYVNKKDIVSNMNDFIADLTVEIIQSGEKYSLIVYYSDKYSSDFIARFTESYKLILHEMLNVDKLSDINYISADDIKFLDKYNETDCNLCYDDVLDAFNNNLSKCSDNKLVSYGNLSYTYGEGAFLADKIAQKLIDLGVNAQDCIGFLLSCSEYYIFNVLAIMSIGAIYVPLDEALPDERLRFILNDSDCKVVIVSDETNYRVSNLNNDCIILNISEIINCDVGILTELPVVYGDLACVLYTSGTTGLPKGVKITRKSIVNVVESYVGNYGLDSSDVYALFSAIGFDVSNFIIAAVLYSGACLSVIPEDIKLNMVKMNEYFIKQGVTHAFLPTQVGKLFMQSVDDISLDVLLVAGEKLGKVKNPDNYKLVDAFGPTEAFAFVSSTFNSKKIIESSVGHLNYNTKAYILDNENRRVPVGAVGELCLSGYQIADGYLNRTEETENAFINNPFDSNEDYAMMYRTGDMVRLLPDGSFGFVGRRDSQVKIRGNRVELSEVEGVIYELDYVEDVTVQAVKNMGNNELVAYVVASDVLDENALRMNIKDYVGKSKPGYMVPSFVVKLDKIPLNVNGKVNRHDLPDVAFDAMHAEYVAPTNETEKQIVEAFEVVFNQKGIGLNDNFIRLGGDSIMAIRLISLLEKNDIFCKARDILNYKTPYLISQNVEKITKKSYDATVGPIELLPIQKYFFDKINENEYSQEFILKSKVKLDLNTLQEAFDILTNVHDMLRANYTITNEGVVQQIMPLNTRVCEIEEHYTDDLNSTIDKIVRSSNASLDINGDLIKINIVHHDIDCYVVFVIHHLIIDGVSWGILFDDLAYIYMQLITGDEIKLSRPYPYKSWVKGVQDLSANISDEEKEYWVKVNRLLDDSLITGKSKLFTFNTDVYFDVDNILTLSEDEYIALSIARAYKKTYHEDIIFNRESHGRDDSLADVSRTVGWFTSQFPVPVKVNINEDIVSLMEDVYVIKKAFKDIGNLGLNYGSLIYFLNEFEYKHCPVTLNFLSNEFVFKNELFKSLMYYSESINEINIFEIDSISYGITLNVSHVMESYVISGSYAGGSYLGDKFNEFVANIESELKFIGQYESDTVICALSDYQLGIYLDENVNDMGVAYSTPGIFDCGLNNSVDEIKEAIHRLIDKHPVLRGRVVDGEVPLLVCDAFPSIEVKGNSDGSDLIKPFDLNKSLVRFYIVENDDSRFVVYDMHHIISDATSCNIINDELSLALNGELDPSLDLGFVYACRDSFESKFDNFYEESHEFFKNNLSDLDDIGSFVSDVNGSNNVIKLPIRGIREDIGTFCHECGITVANLFNAVFAYTYSRFTGSNKVYYNFTEHGRHENYNKNSCGMFVRTIPLVVNCKNTSVKDYLSNVSDLILDSMMHSVYPFHLLASEFDLNNNVLFEYNFDLNDVSDIGDELIIDEIDTSLISELLCVINDLNDGYLISITSCDKFSTETIIRFLNAFKEILMEMLAKENLSDINYISKSDLEFLDCYNQTEHNLRYSNILEAFNDNLSMFPDEKLVFDDLFEYSYSGSAYLINEIKLLLLDTCISGNVALFVDRNHWVLLAALGVLASGNVFVPIDENYPDKHIAFMIKQSSSKVIVTTDTFEERIKKLTDEFELNLNIINVSPLKENIKTSQYVEYDEDSVNDVACILYTSGTTGVPKAVQMTNIGIVNMVEFYVDDVDFTSNDVQGIFASVGFDVSLEQFASVFTGGSVTYVPNDVRLNINKLNDYFIKHHVTHTLISTQVAKLFIDNVSETSLKYLQTAGEKLGNVYSPKNYTLLDVYGPTETNYITTIDVDKKIDYSSVGRPIWNTKVYLLDKEHRRVPLGAIGEIYLSGYQTTKGYFNNDEENKKALFENPFDGEINGYEVMYKTGDLGRYLPDGTIGIVGRIDSQVKIRGNRVELSEIESAIRQLHYIKDVTVQVTKNNELVAYVVLNSDIDNFENMIKNEIALLKPDYMVPTHVICINEIPLTKNSKVDKKLLPEVDIKITSYNPPTNKIEKKVVNAFEKIFEVHLGIDDDFFKLGGSSLSAIKICNELKEFKLTVADILKLRIPKNISNYIYLRDVDFDFEEYSLESYCPLNESQLNVYLDVQKNNKFDSYKISMLIKIPSEYTFDDIGNALNEMFNVHPILKTHVEIVNGLPNLIIGDVPDVVYDESVTDDFINEFIEKEFDLSQNLSRFLVFQNDGQTNILSVFHHLIFDGTSMLVFRKHLFKLLEGEYLDVDTFFLKSSAYGEKISQSDKYTEAENFYSSMLENVDDILSLTDVGSDETDNSYTIELTTVKEDIGNFLYDNSITENILFTGVFAYSLSRFTGDNNVLFNIIESGRLSNYNSIGMFVNVLPIVLDCNDEDINIFLSKVSDILFNVLTYNFYPYRNLVNEYNLNSSILFQFGYDDITLDKSNDDLSNIEVVIDRVADLQVVVSQDGESYKLNIAYSNNYSHGFIKNFAKFYDDILKQFLQVTKLSDINFNNVNDLEIMDSFNETSHRLKFNNILEAFNYHLKRSPNSILTISDDVSYTYGESAYLINNLILLLKENHLSADDRVSVFVDCNHWVLLSALSCLSQGITYIPIDENYPDKRIAFMIKQSHSKAIITTNTFRDRVNNLIDKHNLDLKVINVSVVEDVESSSFYVDYVDNSINSVACIIYTSGTTGTPKAVQMTTSEIVNFMQFYANSTEFNEDCVQGIFVSVGFDISLEMFVPIFTGGGITFVPNEIRLDLIKLNEYYIKHGVTHTFITTQVAKLFVNTISETSLKYLRTGGEKLGNINPPSDYILLDLYGPAEYNAVSSINVAKRSYESSVGCLNWNTKIYILDTEHRRVPFGAVGEIYVSGVQITDGYLDNPGENQKTLFANPFDGEIEGYEVMYKTGDLGRYLPDGTLGFVGRLDSQVKIRGNRVELSEIESTIRQFNYIKDVTVQVTNGDKLVAYVVLNMECDNFEDKIKNDLSLLKPDYMVPSYVIGINEIPLTPNAKIDKKSLPNPQIHDEYVEPAYYAEEKILDMCHEITDNYEFGVTTNLYQIGLTSLDAMVLIYKIYEEFQKEITIDVIFDKLTVRGIAEYLKIVNHENISEVENYQYYPLSANQMRMFKESMLSPGERVFHVASLIKTEFDNEFRLKRSLIELINLHPSLRLILTYENGNVVQRLSDDFDELISIEYIDELNDEIIDRNTCAFNLIEKPLFNFSICKTKDNLYLFWVFHHIITDNISMNILLRNLYNILLNNNDKIIHENTGFLDYVLVENDCDSENNKYIHQYYTNIFNEYTLVSLPGDKNVDYKRDYYDLVELEMDKEILYEYFKKFNSPIHHIFLLATNLVLNKYLKNNKLMFFTVFNGRYSYKLANTVGCFAKSLLFSFDNTNTNKTLKQSFKEMHDIIINLIKHEPNSFIYDYSKIENEFEFNFVAREDRDFKFADNISVTPCPIRSIRDNTIFYVVEMESTFNLHILYKDNIYSEEYISKFLNKIVEVVEKIIGYDNDEITISMLIDDVF